MSDVYERVLAQHQKDQVSGFIATTAEELPLSYGSISDTWLTAILCKDVPGAKVVSHTLGDPDNGSSNRMRIVIEYNDIGKAAGLPVNLFCKASFNFINRMTLGLSGSLHGETTFYNKIRPLLPIEAPVGYYANFDKDSFNSIVVLGDISQSVTEFCSHKTVMTRARAESQVKLLAKLHGTAYANPAVQAAIAVLPTWPEYFRNTLKFGMDVGACQGFSDGKEVIPERLYAREAEIWPATLASVERHDHLPATLSHGDVHLKNWYVAGSGEMGLSDWQCISRGHWGRDFAYTITTALTIEDRRAWDRDLLTLYLESLAAAGGPKVGFDEAWLHYRQQLMSALAWWTVTLSPPPGMPPDMQPRDITLEFIRRISTAIDDVDSLGAF